MSTSIVVRPAEPSELVEACRLLSLYREPQRQAAQQAAYLAPLMNGTIDPAGLLVAEASGLCGAILTQDLGGALGIVWPPGVSSVLNRDAIEDALVEAACHWLRSRGGKVAQWLPRRGDRDGAQPLERQGFQLVTQLSMWNRDLSGGAGVSPGRDLEFVPSHEASDFIPTLIASYEGSRDCPECVGERTAEELVVGHGAPPSEADPLWYVARRSGVAIGVILLARNETKQTGELSYIGVVPTARLRGAGRELIRFALTRSVELGFRNLTLSVDVRNEPALQLYRAHGFRPYEWRDVYNRLLSNSAKVF